MPFRFQGKRETTALLACSCLHEVTPSLAENNRGKAKQINKKNTAVCAGFKLLGNKWVANLQRHGRFQKSPLLQLIL